MLGDAAVRFNHVVNAFEMGRVIYGFKRIEMPVLESTAVFARSLGETTDVVAKEMYSFEDRKRRSLTLRPEFTAGIARAYITNGWQQHAPLKVATHGPLFRYDRPQKGRYRQFHQLDAEVLGSYSPKADVELLVFADAMLNDLAIKGVTLQLNTLGDGASRDSWSAALVEYFEAYRKDLSSYSLARLDKNPLRILDSKDPRDRSIVDSAPGIDSFLSSEAQDFFGEVTQGLDNVSVKWKRNAQLARGLDYYRHTAFEFVTDQLGAQGTIIGGGRYDGLIEALGGPPTGAVGWAAGIERLAMLIGHEVTDEEPIAVIADHPNRKNEAQRIAAHLRRAGQITLPTFGGNARKQAKEAKKAGAVALLYVRDEEDIKSRLHLTELKHRDDSDKATDRLFDILGKLPSEYSELDGD